MDTRLGSILHSPSDYLYGPWETSLGSQLTLFETIGIKTSLMIVYNVLHSTLLPIYCLIYFLQHSYKANIIPILYI